MPIATRFPLPASVYRSRMTTRFRGLTVRDGVIIEGPAGFAEVSPFWDYPVEVASSWLAAGIEIACLGLPKPLRNSVPVNVTVPATTPQEAQRIVIQGDCRTAKVKVAESGQCLDDDVARLRAIREVYDGAIRVDANGAWDRQTACRAIAALNEAAGELEYVEQPCRSVEDLAWVRARIDVPVAADESIRRSEDPYEVARLKAADVLVLKVQPLGGVRRAMRIAEDIGIPVVVSSAIESSIGIAQGVGLAASLPELTYACGLGTVQLLTDDVTNCPVIPVRGHVPVGMPTPDARRPVDLDLEEAWAQRLDAMWDHLRSTTDVHELTGGVL